MGWVGVALANKTTFQQELDQGIASSPKSWLLTNLLTNIH